MSKYDPLKRHLAASTGPVEFEFAAVEKILGFSLPVSAKRYAAWWSNSGGTHVQAAAWLEAGYRTENVSIDRQTVHFVPNRLGFGEMKQTSLKQSARTAQAGTKSSEDKKPGRHPAFGALKGMITLLPDVDYTQPADPDWGKVYED